MKFKATEIGFTDGVWGASNSKSKEEYHYLLFGSNVDKQHPSNSGVYFEYDDQINGGVNQVKEISIRGRTVEFSMINKETIIVDCSDCPEDKWVQFADGICSEFSKMIIKSYN